MNNLKYFSKRGLALLLTLAMCLGMLQITAFASESLVCGKEEHTHTQACYELICGLEETPEAQDETKDEAQDETKDEAQDETKDEAQDEAQDETKNEVQDETKDEVQDETKDEAQDETKDEAQDETKDEAQDETKDEAQDKTKDEAQDEVKDKNTEIKDEASAGTGSNSDSAPATADTPAGTESDSDVPEESGSAGGHKHGPDCYKLICGKEEHQHSANCYAQVPAKVTLTYDANAGEDKVTGLPTSQTVESGKNVTIKSYRGMEREGYKILGWSTDPDAVWPDTGLRMGDPYTLNEDTTFYAVWDKIPGDQPEVPDGAKLQEVVILPNYQVYQDGGYVPLQKVPIVRYDYSYEYGGQTYTGTTENQKLMGGLVSSSNQVLKVLVDESGGTPTQVQLTLRGEKVEGCSWFAHMIYDANYKWTESREKTVSVSVNSSLINIWMNNYYQKNAETEPDDSVTEREVDIVVAFVTGSHESFTRDKVSENYAVTYSYQDAEGKTVTETLHRRDAEEMDTKRAIFGEVDGTAGIVDWDEDHLYHHFKWTVKVPVVGDGIYLTMSQSNYGVTEVPYVWDHVFGTTQRIDGENIGQLYVSKDNNPVTPYIYNVYVKEYTVTYVDGVDGSEIFADQVFKAKEGTSTPTTNDPTRSGYTFTGWYLNGEPYDFTTSVTGDITLVARWSSDGGGEGGGGGGGTTPTPTPTPDPTPDEPDVDVPNPDVPLVDVPDVDVPMTELPEEVDLPEEEVPMAETPEEVEISEEDVPLANVPKTGDISNLWYLTALLSAGILAFLGLRRRDRH